MPSDTTPSKQDVLDEILRQGGSPPTDKPEPPAPIEDDNRETARELAYAKLLAFQRHHSSKGHWSIFMMAVLAGLVIFQIVLLIMVGQGKWDFTRYEWLLPLLLVQNLAQIIGLAHVVVRALFDSFKE